MGEIDTLSKEYVSRADVFADAMNYYLYQGKQVIKPDDLSEQDITEIAIPYNDDTDVIIPVQKLRDILKLCTIKTIENTTYVLLGIENQANIHYALPIRTMLYDVLNYADQTKKLAENNKKHKRLKNSDEYLSGLQKNDKLKPVITTVLYWGAKDWDGPRSLHEMLDIDDSLKKFVQDYHINIIVPKEIENFEKFHSGLRYLLQFIKCSDNQKEMSKLLKEETSFRSLEYLEAQLLGKVTGISLKTGSEEGGKFDMCKAWEDHAKEVREITTKEVTKEVTEEVTKEVTTEVSKKERIDTICECLENYGEIPEEIMDIIMSQEDLEILKLWRKMAIQSSGMEDFYNKISSML
ncbi:MAG: Rpn family recombination-promoting nuclease/putative transposase [Lachnospiraceae bacterium]|nr:Rpn family recombination-promoting nuclease/putative transposase [Lachnospiraceae bacterium]MDD3615030.1 Rpn family recombination-promoting nuclease/putative transposase [Lachnospiraceae bacterium]